MNLVINEENLVQRDVQEVSTKVRGLLVDDKEQVLVVSFGGIVQLPGGKVEKHETSKNAIIRELKEEVGKIYTTDELSYVATLNYYQKNYPKVTGETLNRLVQTHYFYGDFKGISLEEQKLEQYEKDGDFNLNLILISQIEDFILSRSSNNPRSIYFKKEILTILNFYKNNVAEFGKVKKIGVR